MMVRGNFAQLLAPGVDAMFVQQSEMEQKAAQYPSLFNVMTDDSAYYDEVEFAGMPPMGQKLENEAIDYFDIIQGGSYRYTHMTYGQGARASWELIQDDKYGLIKKVPSNFARTAQHTKEQNAWNVLNNGFGTQVTTDGVSLFNSAHPLLGGAPATTAVPTNILGIGTYVQGTYPNRPGTDMDLGVSALQLMINQCERMVDGQGILVNCKMSKLVIPPELRWTAEEILGTPAGLYSAESTINTLRDKGLTFQIVNYLTSTTAWFAFAAYHHLKHFDRAPLDEDFADDFDTRSTKWVATYRSSDGATYWYGSWGSNGP